MPSPPRVLIARPDHLGDLLLTLPAALALRRALPGSHMTLLTATPTAAVTRRCPDIDETVAVRYPRLGSSDAMDEAQIARAAATLRDRVDLAVLCRASDRWSGEISVRANVPVRIGYDVPEMRPFLTHAIALDEQPHAVMQSLRLVQEAAACAGLGEAQRAALAASVLPPARVRLRPTGGDEQQAGHVLADAPGAGRRPIVFQPGSGWPLKHWAADRWGALGMAIRKRYGVTPIVNGGPGESALVQAVVDASDGACVGVAERLSMGALAALLGRSSLIVGIDSGPLHLAAVMGVPLVVLFGPLPADQWRPWCAPERYRLLRVSLACSPCDSIFDPPCGVALDPPCMSAITVETVLGAVSELVDGITGAPRAGRY